MIRLAFAACLAIGAHALLFWMEMPLSRPALIVPQSRTVTIDLVSFHRPVEKPSPPKPKAVKPRPKPALKPVVRPVPEPKPVPPVPIAQVPEAVETPEPDEDGPVSVPDAETVVEETVVDEEDDRARVQASIPLYDLNPPPHYPRVARKRNYQGTVLLEVHVTKDGRAAEVRIAQSSGYAILDRSAVKSVRQWRFSPALRGGRPFEMWVQVPVRFELH